MFINKYIQRGFAKGELYKIFLSHQYYIIIFPLQCLSGLNIKIFYFYMTMLDLQKVIYISIKKKIIIKRDI